jgi:CspA family cold shock protein
MTEGTVKFFNAEKQFGFINGDDGKSYYFHATQVEHETRLTDGDRVSFTSVQGDRGPKAEKVRKITRAKESEPEETEESEEAAEAAQDEQIAEEEEQDEAEEEE